MTTFTTPALAGSSCVRKVSRVTTPKGSSAATFQRREQVGIGRCVGDPHRTVGGHDFGFEEADLRRPAQPRIDPPPRTRPATLTVRQPPPEPGGRLSWSRRCRLVPDGPRPHRDRRKWSGVRARRDERVVQLDPGHAAGQISSESREFELPK
jgi:hypothetical protein